MGRHRNSPRSIRLLGAGVDAQALDRLLEGHEHAIILCALLDLLIKRGFRVKIKDLSNKDYVGLTDSRFKTLILDSRLKDDELTFTIIHEVAHALTGREAYGEHPEDYAARGKKWPGAKIVRQRVDAKAELVADMTAIDLLADLGLNLLTDPLDADARITNIWAEMDENFQHLEDVSDEARDQRWLELDPYIASIQEEFASALIPYGVRVKIHRPTID